MNGASWTMVARNAPKHHGPFHSCMSLVAQTEQTDSPRLNRIALLVASVDGRKQANSKVRLVENERGCEVPQAPLDARRAHLRLAHKCRYGRVEAQYDGPRSDHRLG